MRILLVEDDTLLAKATAVALNQADFVVDVAENVATAQHFLSSYIYHIVLLDLGLPDQNGLSLLSFLRRKNLNIGILILTAQDQIQDRIAGLKAGADDFIVKPYDMDEVIARIQAVLRRMSGNRSDIVQFKHILVNQTTKQVFIDDQLVELTHKEYYLLQLFMMNQDRIVTKSMIEDSFYAFDHDVNSNVIQVHIHHLRRKLGKDIIRTVHGFGYILDRENHE